MVRTKYTKPRTFQPKPRDLVLAKSADQEDGLGILSISDGASHEEQMESVKEYLYMKHVQELKRREEETRMKQLIKRVAAGAAAVAVARELRMKEEQERQKQREAQMEADQRRCEELYAEYELKRALADRDRERRDRKNRKDRERRALKRQLLESERRAREIKCKRRKSVIRCERGVAKRRESRGEMERRKADLLRYEAEVESKKHEETESQRLENEKRLKVNQQEAEQEKTPTLEDEEQSRVDKETDYHHTHSQKKVKSICVVVSKVRASSDQELEEQQSQPVESTKMDYEDYNELYQSRSQYYSSNRQDHQRRDRNNNRRPGRPRKRPESPTQSHSHEPRERATRSTSEDVEILPEFLSEPDILLLRYGTSRYYEDSFENIAHLDPKSTFKYMELVKNQAGCEDYEMARQQFLKLLGHHKATWYDTSKTTDQDVKISRIYKSEYKTCTEYLAYMRLRPGGFRGERYVPDNMDLVFHLLIGRAVFNCRRRVKMMSRGSHISVPPKSTFGIKCCGHDQDAYFVFRIILKKPLENNTHSSSQPVTALQAFYNGQSELSRMQHRCSSQT